MKNNKLLLVSFIFLICALGAITVFATIAYTNERSDKEQVFEDLSQQNIALEEKTIAHQELLNDLEKYEKIIAEQKIQIEKLNEEIKRLSNLYEIYLKKHEDENDKVVYLTFDDGPSKVVTKQVLDILDTYDIKATFFVTGKATLTNPEILLDVYNRGHVIGNHTQTHQYHSIYRNAENFKKDFLAAQENIYKVIGERPTLFRYPGGSITALNIGGNNQFQSFNNILLDNGLQYFDWNVDPGDASGENYNARALHARTIHQSRGKDKVIVLFHDTDSKSETVKALPQIIESYIEMGYRFDILTPDGFTVQHRR